MIYFVVKTKRSKSGYRGYAIEVDRSEPFDIGIDSGWRLWLLGPERQSVNYRSGGSFGLAGPGESETLVAQDDDVVNDEWLKSDDVDLEVTRAAERRAVIFIGAELGAERKHFFLSSSGDSVPAQYALRVVLSFHNLAELPNVKAWAKTLRDMDDWSRTSSAQLCPDADFELEAKSARFLERAANMEPAPGLWLPFYGEKENSRAFGVLRLESRGENGEFVATAYLENDVGVIETGSVLRHSPPPSELEADISTDVPIASILVAMRTAP